MQHYITHIAKIQRSFSENPLDRVDAWVIELKLFVTYLQQQELRG